MIVGIIRESFSGERRVALVPASVGPLKKMGAALHVESAAGLAAGFTDDAYRQAGAMIVASRSEVLAASDLLCQVRTLGANPSAGEADLLHIRRGTTIIGLAEPLTDSGPIQKLASAGLQCFALELIPRITRAQSMDVLSSQATVAGYAAVLLAATHLPKMFPMMMTAAGTITASKVFIIGAGVAGLQGIATARRLGAVVSAFDVRPAVREQVQSLGAKFIEVPLDAKGSEDKGGYAKAMDDAFYRKQQELMAEVVAASDVVITTAAVPGKKSPILVTEAMVQQMRPGSVIVDLAAERGGNCELTQADAVITAHGVTVVGTTNLPSMMPTDASQMFAKNVMTFLQGMLKDGTLTVDLKDEVHEATLLTRDGEIVHRRVREVHGLPSLVSESQSQTANIGGAAP